MGRTLLFRVASGTILLGVSSNHDIPNSILTKVKKRYRKVNKKGLKVVRYFFIALSYYWGVGGGWGNNEMPGNWSCDLWDNERPGKNSWGRDRHRNTQTTPRHHNLYTGLT